MAMTMTLAVNGLIDFPTSCALILEKILVPLLHANLADIGSLWRRSEAHAST
jgi:hypothetical protein